MNSAQRGILDNNNYDDTRACARCSLDVPDISRAVVVALLALVRFSLVTLLLLDPGVTFVLRVVGTATSVGLFMRSPRTKIRKGVPRIHVQKNAMCRS